jgi:hypothetical protein
MSPLTAHRVSLFFGFVVLALTIAGALQPSPPVCCSLPARYAPIIAFELARSVRDLHAIFGAVPGACRSAIASRLDFINWIDSLLFVPVYGAFLVFFFIGRAEKNRTIASLAIAITLLACLADYVENYALFRLSADPDSNTWIPLLIGATETKWVGIGIAGALAVPLLWEGWFGWLAAIACGAGLVAALMTIPASAQVGSFLSNAIGLGWLVFFAVDIRHSFRGWITRSEF